MGKRDRYANGERTDRLKGGLNRDMGREANNTYYRIFATQK